LLKLHIVVALGSLAILSLAVTKGTRHDSPLLRRLLRPIPRGRGDFLADSGYLSRASLSLVSGKGEEALHQAKGQYQAQGQGLNRLEGDGGLLQGGQGGVHG